MVEIEVEPPREDGSASRNAGRALVAATACVGSALLVSYFWSLPDEPSSAQQAAFTILRVALPLIGALIAAGAVVWSPRSVFVLGAAALIAALASGALPVELDSIRLVLRVAASVAAVAAIVMLLPVFMRRLVVSLLILFHFCGILAAVTAVAPPGSSPPWLTIQLWTRYFRPYLQFVYLNNAYHFYSPEPGPATLLWFRIEAQDGSVRWEKVPSRSEHVKDPFLVEYHRRLSLCENVNQHTAPAVVPLEVGRRRALAGLEDGIPTPDEIALYLPNMSQYRPTVITAKRILESYVRFAARKYAPDGVADNVKSIKVYRLVHIIIHPGQLAQGKDPNDHALYMPYYQGEFDRTGKLLYPDDPYLYWLIPILGPETPAVAALRPMLPTGTRQHFDPQAPIRDYLRVHAGSSPWEEDQ
jgi:hypothetical protein